MAEEIEVLPPDEDAQLLGAFTEQFTAEQLAALPDARLSDSAHAALAIAKHFPTPLAALRAARNGRALEAKGRGKEVDWCAQVSQFNVVGIMENAVIRPIED